MDESECLADRFDAKRAPLRGAASRVPGARAPGRLAAAEPRAGGEVQTLGGWLTTIVARVCLNMLRSRNFRREESFGFRVPDPVVSPVGELQPEDEAVLADSVGLALLVVLDALAP